jgi:dTDP-glucose 4,6-dehydratase
VKVLVTGGAGFIGNALVRHLLGLGHGVVVMDKLTYAASPEALPTLAADLPYAFIRGDICNLALVQQAFAAHQPDAVCHLAAETHVDRSIVGPDAFVQVNVVGTLRLLEAAQAYLKTLPLRRRKAFRFLQVSTDEVFGALDVDEPSFTEASPYAPRSPYAASKAAADHLVRAWGHTHGLPILISHGSNTYGPWQYPEKLIPLMLTRGCDCEPMPIYGDGLHVRDWLHVDDHAAALCAVLTRGEPGQSYLIGSRSERTNKAVVHAICRQLDECLPTNAPHERFIVSVVDRLGHDRRYALDPAKLEQQTGWSPSTPFELGLRSTVDWYLCHRDWWRTKARNTLSEARLAAQ